MKAVGYLVSLVLDFGGLVIRISRLFFAIALACLLGNKCHAFEEGLYMGRHASEGERQQLQARCREFKLVDKLFDDSELFSELFKTTFQKADHLLDISSIDSIDIQQGEVKEGIRYPIYYKRKDLEELLRGEKQKNLIAVRFQKPTVWDGESQKLLEELKPFLEGLGYKRILVLGCESFGYHVIWDKQQDPNLSILKTQKSGADWEPTKEAYDQYHAAVERLKKIFIACELKPRSGCGLYHVEDCLEDSSRFLNNRLYFGPGEQAPAKLKVDKALNGLAGIWLDEKVARESRRKLESFIGPIRLRAIDANLQLDWTKPSRLFHNEDGLNRG